MLEMSGKILPLIPVDGKGCQIMRSIIACFAIRPASSAHSAGLWRNEQGTPDVGTASAGMAERADDVDTSFANPAGMTRLKGSQAMVGIQPIYGDFKFETGSSTFGGGSSGNGAGWIPSGGLFYVRYIAVDTELGASVGSYLGIGFDFNDDWGGRYYVAKNELVTAFAQGSVGHRLSDTVSIGAGAGVVYGKLEYQSSINNVIDAQPDGSIKLEDTDVAFAYNFGLLFEPHEDTRIGLAYTSEIDLELEDNNNLVHVRLTSGGVAPSAPVRDWQGARRGGRDASRSRILPVKINCCVGFDEIGG